MSKYSVCLDRQVATFHTALEVQGAFWIYINTY